MMKWVKQFTIAACALFISASLWAAEDSNLTITTDDFGDKYYKEVIWFNDYDLGGNIGSGTYVYSDAIGTNSATIDGLVEARRYDLKRTIQIRITTLGSTSIDVRGEGRVGTNTQWGELFTKNFTDVTTIDYMVNIGEWVEEIRMGARSNTAGTDKITITGSMLGGGR